MRCDKITQDFEQENTNHATNDSLYSIPNSVEVSQYVEHDPEQQGNPIARPVAMVYLRLRR